MGDLNYADPLVRQVMDLVNAEGPASLKDKHFYGDRGEINVPARSLLPMCFWTILPSGSNRRRSGLQENEYNIRVECRVIVDRQKDFTNSLEESSSHGEISKLMWERDQTTLALKPGSILYVIDSHETIPNTKIYLGLRDSLEMGYASTAEERGRGLYTHEGIIHFTITHQQLKPGLPNA